MRLRARSHERRRPPRQDVSRLRPSCDTPRTGFVDAHAVRYLEGGGHCVACCVRRIARVVGSPKLCEPWAHGMMAGRMRAGCVVLGRGASSCNCNLLGSCVVFCCLTERMKGGVCGPPRRISLARCSMLSSYGRELRRGTLKGSESLPDRTWSCTIFVLPQCCLESSPCALTLLTAHVLARRRRKLASRYSPDIGAADPIPRWKHAMQRAGSPTACR